jgi:hypothetical protein
MHLPPAVAASLARWHHMVARRDASALTELLRPDAIFRSPVAYKPYEGAAAVAHILRTVLGVFANFAYHRELATDDGHSVVLEFSAEVGGKQLKGVDLIRFDDAGLICEFEVMIRPASGLQALGAEMAARLAHSPPG